MSSAKARLDDLITIAFLASRSSKLSRRQVQGRKVTAHFAITESVGDYTAPYTLTHLPTGGAAINASTLAPLVKLARHLEKIGDWSFTEAESVSNIDMALIRQAMKSAGLL